MRDEEFFESVLLEHVKRSFDPIASEWLAECPIRFVSESDLGDPSLTGIVIPKDIPLRHALHTRRLLRFAETELTTWELLAVPAPDWRPWPSDDCPMFFVSPVGAMMPSWNVLALCVDLLCRGEESRTPRRDAMGRFFSEISPRKTAGLLGVPAFNEAAAALVLAAGHLVTAMNTKQLFDVMAPRATICLSHDLDMLRGNDRWTQGVRAFRMVRPLFSARPPDFRQAWWIARNYARPYTFYHGNVLGMLELEALLGFRSTLYFLNGSGGRFGARSGSEPIRKLVKELKPYSDIYEPGIHYNFDTVGDPLALRRQLHQLSELLGVTPKVGRAHYLKFHESTSFEQWRAAGIVVDESLGYSDGVGYRCGIAGAFVPRDANGTSLPQPLMLPLSVMDAPLLECGPCPVRAFEAMLKHLSVVGGTLTYVIHPGAFDNPEFPESRYIFRGVLEAARRLGARSMVASDLAPERSSLS